MNKYQSETKVSIQINPSSDSFGLILIENSVWIHPSSDGFELNWIKNLGSDWLRIHSDSCFGINRIESDGFLTVFHQLWRKYRIEIYSESLRTILIHSDICIRANANHSEPIPQNVL